MCRRLLLIFIFLMLTGCAKEGLYYWGDYENSLYQRYVDNDHQQADSYIRDTINEAESKKRIPPGLSADYGFMLYRQGNKNAAVKFFEQEKQLFPESSAFMSTLIKQVGQKNLGASLND